MALAFPPSSVAAWTSIYQSRVSHWDDVTASSEPRLVEEARAKLDDELVGASLATTLLKARRNALSPTERLLPELLARIFTFLAHDDIPAFYDPQTNAARRRPCDILGWIKVTHVCRRWRSVALAHPALWGIDICSLPPLTPARVQRSKDAGIDVRIDGYFSSTALDVLMAPMLAILAELRRIHTLALRALVLWPDPVYQQVVPPLLAEAPLLESFSCDGTRGYLYGAVVPMALPDNLFARRAPRLRQLSLRNVFIPWASPLYDNIVDLSLSRDLRVEQFPGLSMETLLSLLERLPRLQRLHLDSAIPRSPRERAAAAPIAGREVCLPHLKRYHLLDDMRNCLWLTQHLSLPPSATIQVHHAPELTAATGRPSPSPDIREHALALLRLILRDHNSAPAPAPAPPPIQSLSASIDDGHNIHLRGWREHIEPALPCEWPGPYSLRADDAHWRAPAFDVKYKDADRAWGAAVREAVRALGAGVRSVRLSGEGLGFLEAKAMDVPAVLGALPALEAVYLDGLPAYFFIDAFWRLGAIPPSAASELEKSPSTASYGHGHAHRQPFPRLRRIGIAHFDFRLLNEGQNAGTLALLVDALRRRAAPRIEAVGIAKARLAAEHADALRRAVPTLVWDGAENPYYVQELLGLVYVVPRSVESHGEGMVGETRARRGRRRWRRFWRWVRARAGGA